MSKRTRLDTSITLHTFRTTGAPWQSMDPNFSATGKKNRKRDKKLLLFLTPKIPQNPQCIYRNSSVRTLLQKHSLPTRQLCRENTVSRAEKREEDDGDCRQNRRSCSSYVFFYKEIKKSLIAVHNEPNN